MNNSKPLILVLDMAGTPRKWIDFEKAAYYHCKDLIRWTAGQNEVTVHGGVSRVTGERSELALNSIIALGGVRPSKRAIPLITNSALFRRDGHQCAYCGDHFSKAKLTRDHYVARANGGKDIWGNVVTACKPCNNRKGHRCESEYSDDMYFKPYVPSLSEHLLLTNKNVLDDQYDFLTKSLSKDSRFETIYSRPTMEQGNADYRAIEY
ncbi:MAG: HNH endonuclease [Neptunomonas phycophila]|uniref:HNH endonuclease n=1 Tax=Neptunomonas phycophila TaxID=1572645 RepID=UPI003B8B1A05